MIVSQLVILPNVIDPDSVKSYNQYDCIPAGKITKCDWPENTVKAKKQYVCITNGKITKKATYNMIF